MITSARMTECSAAADSDWRQATRLASEAGKRLELNGSTRVEPFNLAQI